MSDNILDQVITSKQKAAIFDFDPSEIVGKLFSALSDREKEIICRRHGLCDQPKATLEEIGKQHKVTRERVRQVENSSLKKIKESFDKEILHAVENLANAVLAEYGGVMTEERLITQLLQAPGDTEANRAAVRFLLNQLLSEKFQGIKETDEHNKVWASMEASWEHFLANVRKINDLVAAHQEPLPLSELIEKVNAATEIFWTDLNEELMTNILDVSKKVNSNIYNEWGVSDWSTIKPKRMNDKIYMVLKKAGKPMHFSDIAKAINEAKFDNRIAYPATIHNELILDNKFVLVGRGIYALTEWGYKPGVVTEVIEEVMNEAGKPMTKDQIITNVLKKRIVKKSTIVLALMNKDKFVKNPDKTYRLKTE